MWGTRSSYDRPAVILLTRYVRMPGARRVPVTRRGVLRRDGQRCGYCAKSASDDRPCAPALARRSGFLGEPRRLLPPLQQPKGNRTPQEMGWQLRIVPQPPRGAQWTVRGTERGDPVWEPYLALAA